MRRLKLHHSNRLEILAKQFAALQRVDPLPPLQQEVVVVQNIGMGRWLSLQTAKFNGIMANMRYLFPAEMTWELLRHVLEAVPDRDPCAPATLRWRILAVLQQEPEHWPELKHYFATGDEGMWQLAGQIAKVFDQYLFFRPDWVRQWESGESLNVDWQARLWIRVIGNEQLPHWVRLQERFVQALSLADLSLLPKRINFFSVPAVSPGYVQLVGEVAKYIDTHVYLMNPSQAYWGDIESEKRKYKKPLAAQELVEVGNPLLASWGRQGRDFLDQLIETEPEEFHLFDEQSPETLLQQVQNDILQLVMPGTYGTVPIDESIRLHICHSPMREVEVLYDQLLALFEANPDLTPADVVVMTPDIDTYAPYIDAVFATAEYPLPYSIADGSPRFTQSILNLCLHLLELPQSRCDTESILAILEFDEVRQHLGLNEAQVIQCRDWIRAVNIRWGSDAPTRAEQGGSSTPEHTWRYGLDRMLLGYALPGEELFAEVLPYSEIEGSQAEVLGLLQAMLEVLFTLTSWPQEQQLFSEWDSRFRAVLKTIVGEEAGLEAVWQALDNLQKAVEQAYFDQPLAWAVFKSAITAQLDSRSESEGFLGRGITFCAMMPMRTVPFRFVGIIGMNDGIYPRRDIRASFDRMSVRMRRGDRLKRDEDRYLFLESVLSARDWLYISYVGQSLQDNSELPPSVLVSELVDYLGRCLQDNPAKLITKHPLQAFSPKYIRADGQLFTYASYLTPIARTEPTPTVYSFVPPTAPPIWNGLLNEPEDRYKQLHLNDLLRFYRQPARVFLRERFGLQLVEKEYDLPIREPFALEKYSDGDIRTRIFHQLAKGATPTQVLPHLRAEGLLPHGELGDLLFTQQLAITENFFKQYPPVIAQQQVSFSLSNADFQVRGLLGQIDAVGRCIYELRTLSYWQWLDIWLHHLALNTLTNLPCPPKTWVYTLVKKERRYGNSLTTTIEPTAFELHGVVDAKEHLQQLLRWYWRGLQEPLPFFPKSGLELAKASEHKISSARGKWESSGSYVGECEKPEYRLLYRGMDPLEIHAEAFTELALGIYGPMLYAMKESAKLDR